MAEAQKPQLPDLFENVPRRGVTENDVWRAADALLLEGRRPTIEAVRRHLGGGSPNTVTPYLDTWYKGLGKRLQDPRAFAAPTGIPEPIAAAAAHFWESALSVARGELEAERNGIARERAEVARDQEKLGVERQRFAAAEAALQDALNLAKTQLENAMARGDRLVARNDALEREAVAVKAELARARDALEAERLGRAADAKAVSEAREADARRFEATERHWIQEADRAREGAKAAQAELQKVTTQLARARGELADARAEAREKIVALTAELTRQQALFDNTVAELEKATHAKALLEGQLADATVAHKAEVTQLRAQLAETLRAVGRTVSVHATTS